MALLGIFADRRPTLGAIKLDASTNEGHGRSVRITRSPVASLGQRPDHIVDDPVPLTLTGVLTPHYSPENGLIGGPRELLRNKLSGDRHIQGWQQFVALIKSHEPFTVVTTLDSYPGMVAKRIRTDRTAQNSGALFVTVELEELEVADVDDTSNIGADLADIASPDANLGTGGTAGI